ncbi:sterol desaturase family protein [Novosphingobium sp. G106]|uniref:sterol desaturase family protein n=1 Tax=Novosphingobium sp. G106 TaxID=2849500 RepID=UPI001C2CC7EF|nr:sterol desaturase family protein [Novosphingobium sp. G106]MBV1691730.1 sterol desaturase family protein [Novosphingobium sp. G106]
MVLALPFSPLIGTVLALTAIERVAQRARSDWWINLQAWALLLFTGIAVHWPFELPASPSLIDGAALPFWIGFPAFLIVSDLGEYLFHRAQHRIPLLWAMHSLHHSDPDMSALTTQRHYWADPLIKKVTIWAATALIIAPTPEIAGATGLASLWSFVTHSRLRIDIGRWSWLINTPAYHRRHHSSLPEHYDSNFAAIFPIFDVICGSYYRPDGFPPTGLARAPQNMAELIAWPLYYSQTGETPAQAEAITA